MSPLFLLLALAPAPAPAAPSVRAQYLMGTVCEAAVHGPRAAEAAGAAFAEIARWERVMSTYREDSELSGVNRRAAREAVPLSPDLESALALSLRLAEATGGAFDPAAPSAVRAGKPPRGAHRLVRLEGGRARFLEPWVSLDLGGIGKGIALDAAARVLRGRGATAALLNFGGQVYALGAPPGERAWAVSVPGRGEALLLSDASASTSGDSERPGHIVSPFTGRSVRTRDPVTAVAASAAEADAWSTAYFVLGRSGTIDLRETTTGDTR